MDKPFTLSVAEADELIARRGGDRRLSVFHNWRWDGDFLTVRRCLEADLLGEVSSFVSRYDRFRPVPKGGWKEEAAFGSGVLWDLGPHLIDQALQLFGTPHDGLGRRGRPASRGRGDYVHLVLGYGRLRCCSTPAWRREPGPRFEVHGDRGSFVTRGMATQEAGPRLAADPATRAGGTSPPTAAAS